MRSRGIATRLVALAAAPLAALSGAGTAIAQNFPVRPIEIIVPAAAGGGLDINARVIAKGAQKVLGQPININNVVGGGTAIGYQRLLGQKPDGYTLAIGYSSVLIQHLTLQGITYKRADFEPIIMVSTDANVLAVKAGSRSDMPLDKFMPYLKANTDKLNLGVGSKWAGSDLAYFAIQGLIGKPVNKVYFPGGAPAIAALLAGDVDVVAQYYAELKPHVEAKKITPIATLGRTKHPKLPNLPVMRESGYDVVAEIWRGFIGPKGIPAPIVAKLHDAFKAAIDDPTVKAELAKAAIEITYMNTADFNNYLIKDEATDIARVKGILAAGGK